nr:TMV resistance protein N-like [Ipomoea batatas]
MDALLHQPPRPNPQPNPRLMKDFGKPQVGGSPSCIVLTDAARNYELKTVHYNQLPSFHGTANEDALTFIRDFYGIVQHFPLNDLTEDALRMRCFPYTLKDAAKTWFMTLTPGSLRTWLEVYNKFIGKFYSHAKTAELRRKITTFSQAEGEPFHEAWERFNMLLIQCPHHGYTLELQNQTFYDGLTQTSQSMVDNAAGGAIYFGCYCATRCIQCSPTVPKPVLKSRYDPCCFPVEWAVPQGIMPPTPFWSLTNSLISFSSFSERMVESQSVLVALLKRSNAYRLHLSKWLAHQ